MIKVNCVYLLKWKDKEGGCFSCRVSGLTDEELRKKQRAAVCRQVKQISVTAFFPIGRTVRKEVCRGIFFLWRKLWRKG